MIDVFITFFKSSLDSLKKSNTIDIRACETNFTLRVKWRRLPVSFIHVHCTPEVKNCPKL